MDLPMLEKKHIPSVMSDLRYEIVEVPANIKQCSGIQIYGRRIKSVIFTTDVSIIANNNADAVLAVYPFTPIQLFSKASCRWPRCQSLQA